MFLYVFEAERDTPSFLHLTESGRQRQGIPFKKQPERFCQSVRGGAVRPT